MTFRPPPVRFSFSLAMFGVGAMVLAAGGETLWHVNSAAAAQGSSRLRAPTAALVAGEAASSAAESFASTIESTAAESNAAMMVDPLFKPFVYVELPMPENRTLVHSAGVHMNNDGVVVATMNDGQDNYGYIWYDEKFADGWFGPITDGTNPIVLDNFGLRGINDEREICGTLADSGPKAFFLALTSDYAGTLTQIGSSGGYAKDINNQGVVIGTSTGGSPVGWWDVVGSPTVLPPLTGGNVTNAIGVTPNTILNSSLIVGQCKDTSSRYQAVVWYNDGSWQVVNLSQITGSEVGFAIDVNDNDVIVGGKLSGGSISETDLWYYDGSSSQWVGVSQGTSPDFIPEAINDQPYPEVVGENYLWICDDVASGTGTQIDLSAYSLGLPTNMINMRCTDINNAGEIVGVGQLGSEGDWVAFKLVPYDVNNNGESDVREIALAYEPDNDLDWLIDWAETDSGANPTRMRVGLHTPNQATGPEGAIEPGQIVRLGANLSPYGVEKPEEVEDEDWIVDIVRPADDDCDACRTFHTAATRWGTGADRSNPDLTSEVLIRVHSMMGPGSFGNHEALPNPEEPSEKQDALNDLTEFAFRFARCIDFIQFGNESFGGARGYMFREDELDCDSFDEGTLLQELPANCRQPAVQAILDWQEEQMWAALRGSALGGRPLRMTSSGITYGNIRDGYDCQSNPVGCYLVSAVSEWCNENQMYFAMHLHYETVADATGAIQKLTDTFGTGSAPWDVPNWLICTELGARAASHAWWTLNTFHPQTDNLEEYIRFFFPNLDPPDPTYEAFVTEWAGLGTQSTGQWGASGPQLNSIFDEFATAGFAGICWSTHQWDKWTEESPSPFLIEALQANGVLDDSYFESTNQDERYSPLLDLYETAGADHAMSSFVPHDCGCDYTFVCPGCPIN